MVPVFWRWREGVDRSGAGQVCETGARQFTTFQRSRQALELKLIGWSRLGSSRKNVKRTISSTYAGEQPSIKQYTNGERESSGRSPVGEIASPIGEQGERRLTTKNNTTSLAVSNLSSLDSEVKWVAVPHMQRAQLSVKNCNLDSTTAASQMHQVNHSVELSNGEWMI